MSGVDVTEVLRPAGDRPLRRLPRVLSASLRLVWQVARREFAVSAALQAVAGAGIAVQLLAARQVLAHLIAEDAQLVAAVPALGALAVATAVVAFVTVGRVEQQRLLAELVGCYAVDTVLAVATRVPLVAFESPGFHDRLERAKINAVARPASVATGVIGTLGAAFAVAGIGAALLVLQPVFLALVLLGYVPATLIGARAARAVRDFAVEQTEQDRRRAYLLHTLTDSSSAHEIRAFDLGAFLRDRHDRLHAARIVRLRALVGRRLRLGMLGAFATSLLVSATLATLLWFVSSGRMDAAAAGAAGGAVVLLGQRLSGLSQAVTALYEGALFVEDFTSFVAATPQVDERPEPVRPALAAPTSFTVLRACEVSFTYPSRNQPSVDRVSLEIGDGEVVALVGENGSGKTTLAKLLAGLYTPDTGAITWDGVDVAGYDDALLRESVAVIFQDFVRYYLSAAENVGMGRHRHHGDDDRIRRAARRAGAHNALSALADGYDTQLGPQFMAGSDLSVGQWQRVALARAFFRDAPFVILDEPTAAVDARAEAQLFADIRSLCAARSVLLISHRLSSVRTADRIYVMRAGRVVEAGSHEALMHRRGTYADLFTLQASRYR